MKTMPLISAVLLLLAALAPLRGNEPENQWLGKTIPQLVLAGGKTYTGVTFSKIEADSVTITHAGGILRIPMEDLQPDSQAALGYDPEKAKAARARFEAEKNAGLAAAQARGEAARAAQQARRDAQMAEQQQQAARAAKLAASTEGRFRVLSVVPDAGLLVRDYYPGSSGGAAGAGAVAQIFGRSSYVAPRTGDTVYLLRNYEGPALADDDTFSARTVATDETFQYTSPLGALATVKVIEAVR